MGLSVGLVDLSQYLPCHTQQNVQSAAETASRAYYLTPRKLALTGNRRELVEGTSVRRYRLLCDNTTPTACQVKDN